MKTIRTRMVGSLLTPVVRTTVPLLGLLLLGAVCLADGHRGGDRDGDEEGPRPPMVPTALQVQAGNEVHFRATGVGVQIYVWTINATNPALASWVLKAPHAVLFHREGVVGIHFAGPTWQANDGSKVVGTRIASVTVDPNAIPWLLLTGSPSGTGILSDTTYIQRLHTVGGLAPAAPGSNAGDEVLVPYIADYVFYRMAQ